jgi:hypothetical protein
MRILADNAVKPDRFILPIVDTFPSEPMLGELIYMNEHPYQGLMIYTGEGWIELYASDNNIWETIIAEEDQKIFNLKNSYPTNGYSINVYKDGIMLTKSEFAEVNNNIIAYKAIDEEGEDIKLKGGEIFEFQIFNKKRVSSFNVKAFNRRRGKNFMATEPGQS